MLKFIEGFIPGGESEDTKRELFGVIKKEKEKEKSLEEDRQERYVRLRKEGYYIHKTALDDVKERQTFHPTRPNRPFAFYLRETVLDLLSNKFDIDERDFKYYTAVAPGFEKTPLQIFHNTDAFFELETGGEPHRVTFKLTTNEGEKLRGENLDELLYISKDFPSHARIEGREIKGLSTSELNWFLGKADELAEKIFDKLEKIL